MGKKITINTRKRALNIQGGCICTPPTPSGTLLQVQHHLTHFENCLLLFIWRAHLQNCTERWGQGNCVKQNNIQKLRTKPSVKLLLKISMILLTPCIYKDLKSKVLKLRYFLYLQNFQLASHIERNQTLVKSFVTFRHGGDKHNYLTKRDLLLKEFWPMLFVR